jgi:hypothetical protein
MKAKLKLLPVVLSIAFSGILLTQCVKNEESDGVRTVREGYAEKLKGDADYQKAQAEKARAEAEKTRITAQWEKDEAAARVAEVTAQTELTKADVELKKVKVELDKVNVELEKVKLEHQQNLNDVTIEQQKVLLEQAKITLEGQQALLEVTKAGYETQLEIAKNSLLQQQHLYAKALIDNEVQLIGANKLLADAKAGLLAYDPNLVEYETLLGKLYNPLGGYYPLKAGELQNKLEAEAKLIELKYAVRADHLGLLVKDSVKYAKDLEYAYLLLDEYENLGPLSVDELQGRAAKAKANWETAKIAAQELNAIKVEKADSVTLENAKLTAENAKLMDIKGELTGSTVTTPIYVDSLYNTTNLNSNAYIDYPASLDNLVSYPRNITEQNSNGAQGVINLAKTRLAYLESASLSSQPTGFGYNQPSNDYPTKKFLEDRIAHIETNLLPSVQTVIDDQKATIAATQVKFDDGKVAWEGAKTAYLTAVGDVNGATDGLRNALTTWQSEVNKITATASTYTDMSTATKNAIFSNIRTYYVTRYNFDRKTATNVALVPTTLADLSSTFTFNGSDYFSTLTPGGYQAQIDALKIDSDIKIRNNYDWRNYDNNADVTQGYAGSPGASVKVTFPTSPNTNPTEYVNSTIGQYLYLSRTVYGANAISDLHYYLPYDKRPTENASGVPASPSLGYDYSSLFYILDDAKTKLANLEADKDNTYYVDNYKTVLALVNRTIAAYAGLVTEYEAKVVKIGNDIKDQQAVVDAQQAVVDAARLVEATATAEKKAADDYATSLEHLYDQLKDATGTTLGIIKDLIASQEIKIATLIDVDIKDANEILRKYRTTGDESDLIAKLVAEQEAKIADHNAQIAAYELIISGIEAKMDALLQQPSLE